MTQEEDILEIREFAEEKIDKYYEIINKYKINADYISPIEIEGPEGGKYKKIGDYYIRKKNNAYYFTKEKYIDAENNKINAYVYVNAEEGYISNIQYWTYDKTGRKPFVQWNLNSIICGMLFEKSGRLSFVSTSFNGKPIITAQEAAEGINRKYGNIEELISSKELEVQNIINDIISLKVDKDALEEKKKKLVGLDKKTYINESLEVCQKCTAHAKTLSAIDKLNKNII